jgi:uridine kinase
MRLPATPLTAVVRELRDEVRQHHRGGRVALAVDGFAGTAQFADHLAEAFAEEGGAVLRASLDGFRRPRAERLAVSDPYLDAHDLATFRRALLDPFRTAGGTGFQLAAYDAARDAPLEPHWTTAPRDAVLIVDGPFLLRSDLRGAWNWSVWLEVFANPDAADSPLRAAQQRYLREARPRTTAAAIVENTDPARPVRVFGDFC